jgi:hypothetical protein
LKGGKVLSGLVMRRPSAIGRVTDLKGLLFLVHKKNEPGACLLELRIGVSFPQHNDHHK